MRRFRLLVVLMAALTMVVVVWRWSDRGPAERLATEGTSPPPAELAVAPAPRPQGYVGSAACAACHADISASFAQHPMGRSIAPVPEEAANYDLPDELRVGRRTYRVERRDGRVLHHELMIDEAGEVIYDQAEEIEWAIGSGRHGFSYVLNRDGALFQSPISWDTRRGHWRLSPGYENASELRFERRLTESCLLCHAGRLRPSPESSGCFLPPVFEEMTISCERCHGPGERHVAVQESLGIAAPDATIVNPGRLDFARRDAVCQQCHLHGLHLPRHGRTLYDFRPGDRLEDTVTVLVDDLNANDGAIRSANHVVQLRSSKCYTGSEGALGCISCHDPHSRPPPVQTAAYFRQRCLQCHAEQGCALPAERREELPAAGSCIHCHMPNLPRLDIAHSSATDHRLLRTPSAEEGEAPDERHPWAFFDDCHERLPEWEVARAMGLAMMNSPDREVVGRRGRSAEELLRFAARFAPDDVPLLGALGTVESQRGLTPESVKLREAVKYWERGLEIEPFDEVILRSLAKAYSRLEDWERAEAYQRRLLRMVPHTVYDQSLLSEILLHRGDLAAAAEAGERAIRLDPTLVHLRSGLIGIYERLGDAAAAERHRGILQRIETP